MVDIRHTSRVARYPTAYVVAACRPCLKVEDERGSLSLRLVGGQRSGYEPAQPVALGAVRGAEGPKQVVDERGLARALLARLRIPTAEQGT